MAPHVVAKIQTESHSARGVDMERSEKKKIETDLESDGDT